MTLLCIGQTGQVATALQERADLRSTPIVCTGRPETDLRDRDSLARAIDTADPGIVVNAAAYTAVDAAESDRDSAFAINATGAATLAELCAERGLPLLHLSTEYVFDGSDEHAYREDDPVAPINVYGASKSAGETLIRDRHRQHIILRTSWVYSPFGTNFVKTMLRLAKEKGAARVVDDQIGSPTNALDIADVILQITEQVCSNPKAENFGTYHYSASGYCSWADLAAYVFDMLEDRTSCATKLIRILSSEYPSAAPRPLNSRMDTTKLTRVFGIRPVHWQSNVPETIDRLLEDKPWSN
ncbi:MAG: dTDP-4-dehydrorhamnose reductase [Pseudomonadota bacterium]